MFRAKVPGEDHLNYYLYFICIGVLPTYVYRHRMHAWYLRRSEEGVGSLELEL